MISDMFFAHCRCNKLDLKWFALHCNSMCVFIFISFFCERNSTQHAPLNNQKSTMHVALPTHDGNGLLHCPSSWQVMTSGPCKISPWTHDTFNLSPGLYTTPGWGHPSMTKFASFATHVFSIEQKYSVILLFVFFIGWVVDSFYLNILDTGSPTLHLTGIRLLVGHTSSCLHQCIWKLRHFRVDKVKWSLDVPLKSEHYWVLAPDMWRL